MIDYRTKFIKLDVKYGILDGRRKRDMDMINVYMRQLLELFSEEVIWDKLHIIDKESQMHQLQLIVKNVRNITVGSNKESNKVYQDER